MTAKDSKSTPKKAEDATRHPLALLADHLEAKRENRSTRGLSIIHPTALRNALRLHDTSSALLDLDPAALRAEQARINALEAENAALRAQAEAEAGLREVAGRVVRKLETAHELAEVVNNQRPHGGNKLNMIDQLERIENATSMLRAALAQAGGEG